MRLCWEHQCPAEHWALLWPQCPPSLHQHGSNPSWTVRSVFHSKGAATPTRFCFKLRVLAAVSQTQVALHRVEKVTVPVGINGTSGLGRRELRATHLPDQTAMPGATSVGDPSVWGHTVPPAAPRVVPSLPRLLISLNSLPRRRWPRRGAGLSPSRRSCSPSGCRNRRPPKPRRRFWWKGAARSAGTCPAARQESWHPSGEGNAVCPLAPPKSLHLQPGTLQPRPCTPQTPRLGVVPSQQQRLGGSHLSQGTK